jgi:hypothetical protein
MLICQQTQSFLLAIANTLVVLNVIELACKLDCWVLKSLMASYSLRTIIVYHGDVKTLFMGIWICGPNGVLCS